MGIRVAILLAALLYGTLAGATADVMIREIDRSAGALRIGLSPTTPAKIFERTQAVFTHFGVPIEQDYESQIQILDGWQSVHGLQELLPILDPHGQFRRFTKLGDSITGPYVEGFRDFDSRQIYDFEVALSPKGIPFSRLALPPQINPDKPLEGVRIALDPGHMGGALWDVRTGKYVTDHRGHTVSEGVINLQTALLLKHDLESLGADVMVTRQTLDPVTTLKWEDLNIHDFALRELAAERLSPWFLNLVEDNPAGQGLYEAFASSSHFKRLFSDNMRWAYFVLEADLAARSEMIKKFNPHLTLIIHYDTNDPPGDSVGVGSYHHDLTKVYVPGAYMPEEFATREDRARFAEHLLNPAAFNSSVAFAKDILNSIENNLSLGPDLGDAGNVVTIEPGLMARNLNLTRDLTNLTVAFVECLFYNDPAEFKMFLAQDHEMDIGGERTYYSERLVKVEKALESGLLAYVKEARGTEPVEAPARP